MASPNLLMCDAFKKSVIDAALHFDRLFTLPEYAEAPRPLTQEEAELLADYVEKRVADIDGDLDVPVSLAALASIVAPTSHLNSILGVLRERCGGGA